MAYGNSFNPNWTQPYNTFMQQPVLSGNFVSNIAEAVATKPDISGKPLLFYNKADEEVYIKQYDNTGNAPVKTYKLVIDNAQEKPNPIVESFKSLDAKLDDIKKLLTPAQDDDRRNRR